MAVFSLFDWEKTNTIRLDDLKMLMLSLKKNHQNAQKIIDEVLAWSKLNEEEVSFSEFLDVMFEME